MEQQFSLSWKNFHGNLSNGFADLLGSGEFVDVTLACDGQLIYAHKVVLSICSPYFKRMFQMNPCQHPIVILRDISHRAMNDLVHFMYNGEVSVRREDLAGFINTAETLQIKGLTNKHSDDEPQEEPPKIPSPGVIVNNNVPETQTEPVDLYSNNDLTHQLENTHSQMDILNTLRLAALKRKSEEFIANNFNLNLTDKERIPTPPEKKIKREKQILNRHKILNNIPRGGISVKNFESMNSHPRLDSNQITALNVFNETRNETLKKTDRSYSYSEARSASVIHENNGPHSADSVGEVKKENETDNDDVFEEGASTATTEYNTDRMQSNSPKMDQEDGANNVETPTILRASWPINQQGWKLSSSVSGNPSSTNGHVQPSPQFKASTNNNNNTQPVPSSPMPVQYPPQIPSQHTIITIPQKEDGKKKYPQRSCRFCWRKSGKRRDTRFMCQQCSVPLCKTNCFEQHQTEGFMMSCKAEPTAVL